MPLDKTARSNKKSGQVYARCAKTGPTIKKRVLLCGFIQGRCPWIKPQSQIKKESNKKRKKKEIK
jgi:hypothetical protein